MKLLALTIFCVLAFASAQTMHPLHQVARLRGDDVDWPSFIDFYHKYSRTYKTVSEVNERFDTFKANLVRNQQLAKLNPKATFGVNKFADMSPAEFASKFLMPVNITEKYKPKNIKKWVAPKNHVVDLSASVDYSTTMCTPVKNQGQCGSCWAFSATQTIESANIAAGKGSPSGPILAPEQIVDCDTNDGGCGGGDPRSGMTYVQSVQGQESESSYPYTAGDSGQAGSCAFQSSAIVEDDAGGPIDVSDGDESALQSFLSSTGPPSVCVDASSWQSYTGGIMTSCSCNIDHAVQAVGMNADGQQNSYKVRNSWDVDWGVNGYIYLEMGSNMCCIANEVSWAQV